MSEQTATARQTGRSLSVRKTSEPVAADIRCFLERLSGGDVSAPVPDDQTFGPALSHLREWLRRKTPAIVPPSIQLAQHVRINHLRWKALLRDMFAGLRLLDRADISCSGKCAVGNWIRSGRAPELLGQDNMTELVVAHENCHAAACEAVEKFQIGNMTGAYACMADVEHASESIMGLLDAIVQGKPRDISDAGAVNPRMDAG